MVNISNNMERVALGGLLHDIGKLLNRSNNYAKESALGGKHPHLSSWFIDYLVDNNIIAKDEYLKEIVQKHHEGVYFEENINLASIKNNKELKKLALIVARADNYSSSERQEDGDYDFGSKNFREVPLDSIFSRIKLTNKGGIEKEENRYKVSMFNETNIFSQERNKNNQLELDSVIKNLLEEVKEIKAQDFNGLFVNLMDIIKKYTWALPSDTQKEICEISLYDHLKTTSAIALASYNYHIEENISFEKATQEDIKRDRNENHFLLIGGDISGIQKYIYSLESTEGAAKRLRAKSFFIKTLSDICSYKIVNSLGLTVANIIISSGGKFYILAQNTEDSRNIIDRIKKEINDKLYFDFQGELFLNLETINLSGDDLGLKFSLKYDELNDKLDSGKGKKFVDNILETPILENEIYAEGKKVKLCKICNHNLVENGDECFSCLKDKEIGELLPKMDKLAFYNEELENKKGVFNLFGIGCKIIKEGENIQGEPFLVNYYRNNIERDFPLLRDVYGGYAPTNEFGEIKSFEDISNESIAGNLGIIKGDVDNLGLIFSLGMKDLEDEIFDEETEEKKDIKGVVSISRISTLSRMMDNFFSYWLPETLKKEKEKYGSNYIVYAGGDDFMIVSPWDKAIKVSKFINQKFREFVGSNEDITLTIGISITKSKDPIYFSSRWASEAEEKGKNSGKNGLVVFDTYIPWEKYPEVFSIADFIDENHKNKFYSQSFLYRLLRHTEKAENYYYKNESKYLKYISDFTYDIGRNLVDKVKKENEASGNKNKNPLDDMRIKRLVEYFGIEALDNKNKKEFLAKYMRVVLNYVVRNNRDNRGGDN